MWSKRSSWQWTYGILLLLCVFVPWSKSVILQRRMELTRKEKCGVNPEKLTSFVCARDLKWIRKLHYSLDDMWQCKHPTCVSVRYSLNERVKHGGSMRLFPLSKADAWSNGTGGCTERRPNTARRGKSVALIFWSSWLIFVDRMASPHHKITWE